VFAPVATERNGLCILLQVYFLGTRFVPAPLFSQSRLMDSYRKDATRQETMNSEYTASHLPAAIISRFAP
jgi:hypothetical protein